MERKSEGYLAETSPEQKYFQPNQVEENALTFRNEVIPTIFVDGNNNG